MLSQVVANSKGLAEGTSEAHRAAEGSAGSMRSCAHPLTYAMLHIHTHPEHEGAVTAVGVSEDGLKVVTGTTSVSKCPNFYNCTRILWGDSSCTIPGNTYHSVYIGGTSDIGGISDTDDIGGTSDPTGPARRGRWICAGKSRVL